MAALSTQTAVITGLAITFNTAAGGGDTFTNDGRTIILIRNDDVSSMNVTIVTTQVVETTLNVDDRVVAVGAGEIKMIGPFNTATYDTTTTLTYSSVTSLTIGVIKVS